jgi:hypothetical protein
VELIIQASRDDLPVWASAGTIRQLYGVSETALARLVECGAVKDRKLPGGRAAGHVFKVMGKGSLSEYLESPKQDAAGDRLPGFGREG